MAEKLCLNCGTPLPEKAKFCKNCGYQLDQQDKPEESGIIKQQVTEPSKIAFVKRELTPLKGQVGHQEQEFFSLQKFFRHATKFKLAIIAIIVVIIISVGLFMVFSGFTNPSNTPSNKKPLENPNKFIGTWEFVVEDNYDISGYEYEITYTYYPNGSFLFHFKSSDIKEPINLWAIYGIEADQLWEQYPPDTNKTYYRYIFSDDEKSVSFYDNHNQVVMELRRI